MFVQLKGDPYRDPVYRVYGNALVQFQYMSDPAARVHPSLHRPSPGQQRVGAFVAHREPVGPQLARLFVRKERVAVQGVLCVVLRRVAQERKVVKGLKRPVAEPVERS